MGYEYDAYEAGYGYGGYESTYEGPYFLDLTGQLSGPGSSAYESVHSIGNTYIDAPGGLYQTGYAEEGQYGSLYQHATDYIRPYHSGSPLDGAQQGYPISSIYQTYTSYYNNYNSYMSNEITKTSYTTDGFGSAGRGPIDHSYSSLSYISSYDDGDSNSKVSHYSATYYDSGAVLKSDLNSYSESYNGSFVPYSQFQVGYRSYTDAYGYTTTSYIDTQHMS